MARALLLAAAALCGAGVAAADEYNLVIDDARVRVAGRTADGLTVNGQIPGPTLRFTEGEEVVIHVRNESDAPSSVHWHGLILPGEMDGVPGFNGFPGIAPGALFTYRFTIRQSGTFSVGLPTTDSTPAQSDSTAFARVNGAKSRSGPPGCSTT